MCVFMAICCLALNKTQWRALVTGRYMITVMVLLCYVSLSGMSLGCIVIVLMNNSLLGGQECTDYVDIQQNGNSRLGSNRLAIIPSLNFTCNGRITSITARLQHISGRDGYPFFQVWRAASVGSTVYNKIGEVQLSNDQVTDSGQYRRANITLTNNSALEFQSGDVVGYYNPPSTRYLTRDIPTDGYVLYQFDQPPAATYSVNLSQSNEITNYRQPLLQFNIGMYVTIIYHEVLNIWLI